VLGLVLLGLMDRKYRYSDEATSGGTRGVPLLGILPNLPDRLSDPAQASIAAHCVHQIRTMLQLNAMRDGSTAFAITSASSGDGKTSLSLALGLSFAASGSRTLLIDADLVGGGLTSRLGNETSVGIVDALAGVGLEECVQPTDVADLSLLPIGSAQAHHAGSFSPPAVRKLLAEIRKHYEVIVIDTGPVMGSIEATPICASVDGVVLTVARGQSRPLVERAITHLQSIGSKISGVVFNRAQHKDFEQSIGAISVRSAARSTMNGTGHNGRKNGDMGAVASAVAGSVNRNEN
jgi:capsular exopolysaccharide synthesis family protein